MTRIQLLIFINFVCGNCYAADLELSDVIKEAREAALLQHGGKTPDKTADKPAIKVRQVPQPESFPRAQNYSLQSAEEKITAEQNFMLQR